MVRRPDFISQSRQRVERLALQAEERRLQEVFSRDREELFSRPGAPGRLPKPAGRDGKHQEEEEGGCDCDINDTNRKSFSAASLCFPLRSGTALFRRAVPRKEMIQRSKQ